MHDLDRIQAELESATAADLDDAPLLAELDMEEDLSDACADDADMGFDDLDDDLPDDPFPDGEEDDGPELDDAEEVELAAELLAARDELELETTVRRIVRPRARARRVVRRAAARRRRNAGGGDDRSTPVSSGRRKRRRNLVGKALKGIAKKALPIVGGAIGTALAPGLGTAAGRAVGKGIGKAFGLELEGLTPEDAQFEVARKIVRLGADAADESDNVDSAVDDETAARVSVTRASRRHAPGVVPKGAGAPGPGARRAGAQGAAVARSGRWVRRNGHIVLLGL